MAKHTSGFQKPTVAGKELVNKRVWKNLLKSLQIIVDGMI